MYFSPFRLGKNRAGSQLKHIDLSGCINITDFALKQLSKALTERRQIDTEPDERFLDKNGRPKRNNCGSNFNVMDESNRCDAQGAVSMIPNNERTNLGHRFFRRDDTNTDLSRSSSSKTGCCCGNAREGCSSYSNTSSSSILHTVQTNVAQGDQRGFSDDALRTSRYSNSPSSLHPSQEVAGQSLGTDEGSPDHAVAMERSLEYLSLSGCYKITDQGLR